MKKIIRGINTLIILVAAAATMYGQINLSGKKIHELPALPSNVIDTNYLFIIANPIDGKPYKFKKNLLLSGATGVVDGNYGDVSVSGVSWTINASSVQNSKMAAMANNTYKGNLSGGTLAPQDLTVGQMQSSLGINTKLNATDTASLSNRINSKMTASDTAYLSNRINNKQDLDADLTSISGASGTNTIYYRSAANTWSPVTIGGNMTFSGGTLNSTASGGGTWGSITGTIGNQTDLAYELSQKQAQLVSASNIKTINNISILGSGNISVGGGGSQTLDQTLVVGNTTDTSISINYLINNYSDTNFVYGIKNIITTNIAANDVDYVEPYYGEIIIDSGTIDNEADVYASIINKSGGYAYVLEGFGSVINVTGGTTYETRSYNSQVTIDDDITGNVIGLRHATVHTSGNVGLLISGIQNSLTQSAGTSSDIIQGYSNQLTVSGSNNYIRGFDNYITIQSGTNLNTNGILNIVNATGGTNSNITGERIELNLTGGTAGASTALDVYGPNGISGDPTIAYFRSRMASSYGVVITAHASQSQSLFSIFDSSWGFLFNVGASGQTGIGSIANSSAQLTVTSTTKGFLPPRGTTTQMNNISSPAEGLVFYDLTVHKLYVYDGTTWQACW